jgi:hypothetical protein
MKGFSASKEIKLLTGVVWRGRQQIKESPLDKQ